MNTLQSLLIHLCPNGVPAAKIDDLIAYEQPTKYLVASKSYDDSYATPVLTAGQSFLLGYTNEEGGKYPASVHSPVIIFDDFTTAYKWVDFEFKVKSSAMKMLTSKPGAQIRLRYFWYALSTIRVDTSEHARYWISTFSNLEIPLPPLDVQDEIVRILDTFIQLEAALNAELKTRYQLQTWMQDRLLSPISVENGTYCKLTSITAAAELIRGLTYSKSSEDQDGPIRVLRANNIDRESNTLNFRDVKSLASGTKVKKEQRLKAGDILMSTASGSRSHVGKVAYIDVDLDYYFGGFMAVFRAKKGIHAPYLFHVLSSRSFQEFLDSEIESTTINNLSASMLEKFMIPVPDLETQIEISNKLELLANLIQELKSEIEMRSQQFSYYSNKLLNFKELELI